MDKTANIDQDVLNILKRYTNELIKNNISLKTAILFGSYASGKCAEWSDIDIALVSDKFDGNRFYDRRKIADITLKIDKRIDPITYRPEDFNENEDLFVKEIIQSGVKII